jgi:cytochrome c biogenesis protein CcmG/thiol:disulfide interchange protein DsbE
MAPTDDTAPETDTDTASAGRRRGLPVGPVGLLLITLVALLAAGLVLRVGLGSSSTEAVDVQDALDEQAAGPLVRPDAKAATVGAPAPDVRLAYLDGGTQQLFELKGTPVVLNFWASTCAPCLTEMPAFEEFSAAHLPGPDGKNPAGVVQVVGVAVADPEAAARKMVERTGVQYRNAADPQAEVFRVFGGTSLPRTVVIDAQGVVRDVHSGALTAAELTQKLQQQGLLPAT